jgi:hypothetical protein
VREVLDFWRAVEWFDMPSIPSVSGEGWTFDVGRGDPLPWNSDHPIRGAKSEKRMVWRHTVYVGAFPREEIFKRLKEIFKSERYEELPEGESAIAAFTVTDEGFLVEGSAVLASSAWATVRAFGPGPDSPHWLSGFPRLQHNFRAGLEGTYLPRDEEGVRRPVRLDWDALARCRDQAIEGVDLTDDFPAERNRVRIRSTQVHRKKAEEAGIAFLNSFYSEDLERVADAVDGDNFGAALSQYMQPSSDLDTDRRVDVRLGPEEVWRAVAPDRMPLGRWPADPNRPLGLGQQLAVNEAIGMATRPSGDRVFAVNGPPGTGKTTMLRDLIAALVTERASRLATLAEPGDAFVDEPPHRWRGDHARTVRRLLPQLTGFEVLVASTNNSAVENVTVEIPAATAIDDFWKETALDQADLRRLAGQATRGRDEDTGGGPPAAAREKAWALIAARLGKADHRQAFLENVWWGDKPDKDGRQRKDEESTPQGLRDLLVAWAKDPDPTLWSEAVEVFHRAHERAASIRDDRTKVADQLDLYRELKPRLDRAREAERIARDRTIASGPRREALVKESRQCEEEGSELAEKRAGDRRPFILNLPAWWAWRARDRQYADEIASKEKQRRRAAEDLLPLEAEVDAWEEARAITRPLAAKAEEHERVLSAYRERPGAVLPDDEWLVDREARERRAPWSDVEWNKARTELFLAALELHRAFLAGAAHEMREALDGTMDLISGVVAPGLDGDAARAAWQALFLVVPVVSTTFASLGGLFARLGPESFGWLLIDEAGQATPQSAVGAVWRSRRAVVVGDPLQLEPITTVNPRLEEGIRNYFGVAEEWTTEGSSVQRLADRLNRFGTAVGGSEGSVWVGAPLTVHRRCDHPMFDLCNEIVYGGLMIDATDPERIAEFEAKFPNLPRSAWIDVDSEIAEGHWIPAQGDEFDRILAGLFQAGVDPEQVLAIGPFRDVAHGLSARARPGSGLRAGTIHIAQGKEADVVFLVLGSRPGGEKARRWAASTPNLLNVAVSRARHRLYVIGDRERWRQLRYFDELAAGLPHAPPRGR